MVITVRLELPHEKVRVSAIVAEAFDFNGTEKLVAALRNSSAWRDLSFVAEVDGELVAHVSFTRGWIDAPKKLVEVLILSPMSVVPKCQRQGIGKRLIEESLQILSTRAEPVVFLEGNPAFYSKVGFKPAVYAGFTAPSKRIPERAFQYFPLPNYDASLTGALVYPEAFWEMDSVGLR